ncbi:MAG: ABC transporter substrate-binding protein [Ilumatobacteraceae bacterium]
MRTRTLVGVIAGLSLLAAACGDDDTESAGSEPAAPVDTAASTPAEPVTTTPTDPGTVAPATDAPAGPVPTAIISLSPTATEMLYAIGAGDQVIGVDEFSNYPEEATAKMSGLSGFEPNVEAIAGLEPDLVVTDGTNPGLLEQLDSLGIAHWEGLAAVTLDDVYTQIEQLGATTGHVGEAAELVAGMQADIAATVADVPVLDEPLTYYHELDSSYFTATSDTFIGFVYSQLGLRNIADLVETDAGSYPQLNAEFIISANPDLIFLACTKYCGETAETVAARPGWGDMAAVTGGGVVEMDDDVASRWGPRVVDYLRQASEAVADVVARQPAG